MFLAEPNILNELKDKESNEIIEGLQKFKGIGIWSASIFALFYLNHPDVFAWGDISIKKSIKLLYEEDKEMNNVVMLYNILTISYLIVPIIMVLGVYNYYIKQVRDKKLKFDLIKFIFGTNKCRDV